jgi:hypothetical protein
VSAQYRAGRRGAWRRGYTVIPPETSITAPLM